MVETTKIKWTHDKYGRLRDLSDRGRLLLVNGRPVVEGDDAIFRVLPLRPGVIGWEHRAAVVGIRNAHGGSIEYCLKPAKSRLGVLGAMLADKLRRTFEPQPGGCETGVWRLNSRI